MTPLTAAKALDLYYLEARARLLDLAAILDRIDRGASLEAVQDDDRLALLRQAVDTLRDTAPGRAERLQLLFSLKYDPNWPRPEPR
jgi:hypothetical protein